MNYNKTYYILKRNDWSKGSAYYIEPVNACDCPYDDRLFIYKRENGFYVLTDKASGQSLIGRSLLKDIKNWFLEKGKEAYERVIKNNHFDYEKQVATYQKLLEAVK